MTPLAERPPRRRRSTTVLLGAPVVLAGAPLTAALLAAGPAAASTTHTVTNLTASGPGSLAAAISASESNPGADTIVFDPGLTGSITLSTEFDITQDLVIDGDGRITLDGGGAVRHFDLAPNGQTVTLRGLTMTNGTEPGVGGSVHAWHDVHLHIERSSFTGNSVTNPGGSGGAIYMGADSTLSIVDSMFTGNSSRGGFGGAITFASVVTGEFSMHRTVVTGNESSGGGAVYGGANRLTIVDSVISDNTTTYDGSGFQTTGADLAGSSIHIDGLVMDDEEGTALAITRGGFVDVDVQRLAIDGAARGLFLGSREGASIRLSDSSIANTSEIGIRAESCMADILIESTTVTGNSGMAIEIEGGSLYCADRTTSIRHSTIAGNGVGVGTRYVASHTELDHTIVAGNTIDLEIDVDADWSLVQGPAGHLLTTNHTITGVDPGLFPATKVGALLVRPFDESSPAFNAGDPSFTPPPTTDEVGQTRVAFGRIDIGAWELQPPPEPVVPSFTG